MRQKSSPNHGTYEQFIVIFPQHIELGMGNIYVVTIRGNKFLVFIERVLVIEYAKLIDKKSCIRKLFYLSILYLKIETKNR